MEGFPTMEQTDVYATLGESVNVVFEMEMTVVEETLIVTAEASPLISADRTGAKSNVGTAALETLPTINRDLTDFARTNPFFTVASDGEDPNSISVAGRNSRFNNIQIDGAVNNDLFGLADQGTPGGQSNAQAISLDAIQEVQLVLSDYDVRNGGFTGGLVNAVTRTGTNAWKGSAFYYTRDDSWVGEGADYLGDFGEFSEDQYGFRLGGPIARDKVFFFLNGEVRDTARPTGWSIDGTGGQQFKDGRAVPDATLFQSILAGYGYDPGSTGQNTLDNTSDNYFVRFDFNVAANHQLTLRHNYVDAENLINRPGSYTYEWPNEGYLMQNETNSTVGQLNSTFGAGNFNEARISYQTIEDQRNVLDVFPWIEIEQIAGESGEFEAGGEQYSTHNFLNQDVFELTDNFTMFRGDHTITLGTHNEFFDFENMFIPNGFGAYEFSSVADFATGISRRYRITRPQEGQDPVARFGVQQIGLYAGDQWAVRPNFTLNYGLRVDAVYLPDSPGYNPLVMETFGYSTSEMPDGEQVWAPRVGFNWDVASDGVHQIRGGVGIFSGRTPYVWVSNQYGNTGTVFEAITAYGVPFEPDPYNQPTDFPADSTQQVNLIDPSFKFPHTLRYTLAYDWKLPVWDLFFTAEAVFADSQKEIDYKNINIAQTGEFRSDGRPVYDEVSSEFYGAYLLTNTSKGKQRNVSLKLERPFRNGFYGFFAYTWGDSKVVNDGMSSQASSNWRYQPAIDPNNPGMTTSNFEVEHRFNAAASYRMEYGSGWASTFTLYYNLQSGRPYSTRYDTFQRFFDVNGDGEWNNDLMYVPSGPNDVVITNGTWEQLDAYISADSGLDKYRGRIVPRNASQAPWNHTLDFKFAQDIPIRSPHHLQLTFEIQNLWNLFDEDSGLLKFAEFGAVAPVQHQGYDDQGRPIYSLNRIVTDPENNPKFETHNIRSRWRAKLGLRYTF
jgi:hypothetical protein